MLTKKERVLALLDAGVNEMNLLMEMSKDIYQPDDFASYKSIPWESVFGMRNFLSHEYGDVDTEGIFNTVKSNIPDLLRVTESIRDDVRSGKMDSFLL